MDICSHDILLVLKYIFFLVVMNCDSIYVDVVPCGHQFNNSGKDYFVGRLGVFADVHN